MTENKFKTENIPNRELAKQLEKNGLNNLYHVSVKFGKWSKKPLFSLAYNNMTLFKGSNDKLPNSFISKLAETLKCHPTELLPQELLCSPSELENSSEQNLESYQEEDLVIEETQTTQMISSGLKREISSILITLNPREERVLRMRFGLDNKIEKTLKQVGCIFRVSRTRIGQIEARALRKLKHPTRSRKLITYY